MAILAKYRKKNALFDPERQSTLQLQSVSNLQAQENAMEVQLRQISAISPKSSQLLSLQTGIEEIQRQIEASKRSVVGAGSSYSDKQTDYAALQLDVDVNQKQLASAIVGLDAARAEAQRKQLYLERLVSPGKPDISTEPRRVRAVLVVVVLSLLLWGIATLLIAGLREHND